MNTTTDSIRDALRCVASVLFLLQDEVMALGCRADGVMEKVRDTIALLEDDIVTCPYCGAEYIGQPETWVCCGEIGHAKAAGCSACHGGYVMGEPCVFCVLLGERDDATKVVPALVAAAGASLQAPDATSVGVSSTADAMGLVEFERSLGRCFVCQVEMTPCRRPRVCTVFRKGANKGESS